MRTRPLAADAERAAREMTFSIVHFTKSGGPLTKRISLSDGKLRSDGSACIMSRGIARRVHFGSLAELGSFIGGLASNEAIALGALRTGLSDEVHVTTKEKLNGGAPNVVARTRDSIDYRAGRPAPVLLDFDTKGMPPDVADKLAAAGGFWPALVSVLPELRTAARVSRASTSAGLFRTDTSEKLAGSNGQHVYLLVGDGNDAERFLEVLHARCWLAGYGWIMVGKGGQLLERSIVDRTVGAPERLVFEGAPMLDPPLEQDQDSRRPVVVDGEMLETAAACPPLNVIEKAELDELRNREKGRLASEAATARSAFIDERKNTYSAQCQCDGILPADVVLPFDDPELAGSTVGDVLEDPARFIGATLADPLEGIEYGRCKAKVMRGANGHPWIHSFAHGRTIYELKFDLAALRAKIEAVGANDAADTYARLVALAELTYTQKADLRAFVAKRSGLDKRDIVGIEKEAQEQAKHDRARDKRARQRTERRDTRPQIEVPAQNAPWLPQMEIINDALRGSRAAIPPMRDIEGVLTTARMRRVPGMHGFETANQGEDKEDNRLPVPEQWLLTRLNETELAELIEQHIDYTNSRGRSVHLPPPFVRHYLVRHDNVLPIAVAIMTLPAVLADGTVLGQQSGLDRERGIIFRIHKEIMELVPRREDCGEAAVADALRFLTDDWLCDVQTDYVGKCIIIAAALTVIERTLLPERPVFFVTAGRRGGGKTTTIKMLIWALTGIAPAAATWSPSVEERRKALLSYFMQGVPYILWDNIERGSQLTCPHIERSCTTAYYQDRRLGVSEVVAAAASAIQFFTGNNIGPRGDLASRSLHIRLDIGRPDPENRAFTHPDPIGWALAQRGKILRSLYTILLGNPVRGGSAKTRFKDWWRLVGSAVEHAASAVLGPDAERVDFQTLLAKQDEADEDSASLADFLEALLAFIVQKKNSAATAKTVASLADAVDGLRAKDVADLVNDEYSNTDNHIRVREFLFPDARLEFLVASVKSVTRLMASHVDEPVWSGRRTLVLRRWKDTHNKTMMFRVEER
jgi:hypothetical protein